jgi:hypothetical protein
VHHIFTLYGRVDAAQLPVFVVAAGVFARDVIEVAHDEIIQLRSVEDCLIWFFVLSSWECRLCSCGYEDSGKYNAEDLLYGVDVKDKTVCVVEKPLHAFINFTSLVTIL